MGDKGVHGFVPSPSMIRRAARRGKRGGGGRRRLPAGAEAHGKGLGAESAVHPVRNPAGTEMPLFTAAA